MKARIFRILSVALAIMMVVGIVAGCGSGPTKAGESTDEASTEKTAETSVETAKKEITPFTFTQFADFSYWDTNDQTPVMKEIEKLTGVTIKMERCATGDGQQLNIMAASGDMPDVISLNLAKRSAIVGKMIAGQLVYSINDLVEKYAPAIYENVSPDIFRFHRFTDGKNYYFMSHVWDPKNLEQPDFIFPGGNAPNMKIREDIYEAIGKPVMNSPDALFNALKAIKEKYPKLMPFYCASVGDGMNLYSSYDFSKNTFLLSQFGLTRYDVNNGMLASVVRNPKCLDAIKYMNKLYTNGLLAPESFVDDDTTKDTKVNKGEAAVFSYYLGYNKTCEVDGKKINNISLPYFDGAKWVTNGAGWVATMITKKAKDPERIIKFFEFLTSKEGVRLIGWGMENVHWKYDDKGVPGFLPEYDKLRLEDWDKFQGDTGINQIFSFLDDYEASRPYNSNIPEEDIIANGMYKPFCEKSIFYGVMNPSGDTEEGIILSKIVELSKVEVLKAILAKNEAQCESIFNDFVKKSDELGLAKVEAFWTNKYNLFK